MRLIFVTIMLLLPLSIAGQSPLRLTLSKAIELALENGWDHRISQKQVEVFKQRLKNNPILPQITLDGYKNLDEKLQIIEIPSFTGGPPQQVSLDFTKNYEFTLQLVQPILTGGQALFGFKNAKLDLHRAREGEKQSREQTILNVKRAFYNLLLMRAYHQAQQEALELTERSLQNVKARYELGLVSQYDFLRAELAQSAQRPEVLRAGNLMEIAWATLRVVINVPEGTALELEGELTVPRFDADQETVVARGLAQRFELKSLEIERAKTANLLKMAYGQFLPTLAIVARYNTRSDHFRLSRGNWEDHYTINLAVSLPIFPGLRRNTQIGELRVTQKIVDLSLSALRASTRLEIENRFRTVRGELETIDMAQKRLVLAQEGARVAELNHQEGLINLLELQASNSEITQAQVALLQTLYTCNLQIAELEAWVGGLPQGGER